MFTMKRFDINLPSLGFNRLAKGIRQLKVNRQRKRHAEHPAFDYDSGYDSNSSFTLSHSDISYSSPTIDSFSLASSLSSAAGTCASIERSDQNKEGELTSEIVRRNSEYEIYLEQISTAKRIIQSKRWQYGVRGKRLSEPPSSFSHPPPENPPAVDIPQDQYQLIQAAVIPESIGSNQITAVSIQNCQRLSPGLYSYSLLVSGHCQNTNIITHTSEDFYRLQATLENQYKGKYKIPNLPTPLTVGVEHSWKRRCLLSVILKEKQEKFEAFCNNIIRMPASVSRCHIVNEFFSIQCESYEM